MTNQPKTIWFDMTDMVIWSGHLTGTQRVVYEIARRYNQQNQQAAFFVFNQSSKTFHQIPFEALSVNNSDEINQPTEVGAQEKANLSIQRHLLLTAIRAYQKVPYELRAKIKQDHKVKVRKVVHKLRNIRASRSMRNPAILKNAAKSDPLIFSAGDTVVLLGKPWDTSAFIGSLRLQKLKQSFKVVHLIYDMIPTFLPQVFGKPLPKNYTCYMFEALSLSEQILAISESTKKDVERFCDLENLPKPPISVIRLGDSFTDSTKNTALANPKLISEDFILCVGTVEVRKNHVLLYAAYKKGLRQGEKLPKLVIVGGKGWYTGDILYQLLNDPETKDLITILNNTDDIQLEWLYQNCLFTIFPSIYEGWGLPVAESLNYGKVVLSSDSSSMPEIAGDLVDYFSPYDAVGCLSLITSYQDNKIRADKERIIKEKYKPTSWDQTFQQVSKVLNSLL